MMRYVIRWVAHHGKRSLEEEIRPPPVYLKQMLFQVSMRLLMFLFPVLQERVLTRGTWLHFQVTMNSHSFFPFPYEILGQQSGIMLDSAVPEALV
jgi:hypothetical protein